MATDTISTSSGILVVRESRGMGVTAVTGMGTRDTIAGRVLLGTDRDRVDRVDRVDHQEEGEGTRTPGKWRGMESIRHRRKARTGMVPVLESGHTVGVRMVVPVPEPEPDHMVVVVVVAMGVIRTLATLTEVVEAGTEPRHQRHTAVIPLREAHMAHLQTRMAVHRLAVTAARAGMEVTGRVQEARTVGTRMRRNPLEVISGSEVNGCEVDGRRFGIAEDRTSRCICN